MTKKLEHYLNSKEACEYLGIKDVDTLYQYVHSGKLKGYKLGANHSKGSKRHWRFLKNDLDAFVARR